MFGESCEKLAKELRLNVDAQNKHKNGKEVVNLRLFVLGYIHNIFFIFVLGHFNSY